MQYLSFTSGKMVVHMGVVPGGEQEKFVMQRLKGLKIVNPSDVVVMHMPEGKQDERIKCTWWPSKEGLWDYSVLKRVRAMKPRLLILPRLSMPYLHEAEHEQYLENIALILQDGVTVETALSIVEVARVDDVLQPAVGWPMPIVGNYLRKHVADYLLHDSQPQEIMAAFYNGDIQVDPVVLGGNPSALFNISNLTRLRDTMLRYVNSHLVDAARNNKTDLIDLKPNTSLSVSAILEQTIYALVGNAAMMAVTFAFARYLQFPMVAVAFLVLTAPIVTALYVNPFTTFFTIIFTFISFNLLFYGSDMLDIITNASQFATSASLLIVLALVGYLVNRTHLDQEHNSEQTVLLRALLRLSYDMSYTDTFEVAVEAGLSNLKRTLNIQAVLIEPDGKVWSDPMGSVNLDDKELAAAQVSMENGRMVAPDGDSAWLWCPLHLRRTVLGAIGVKLPKGNRSGTPTLGTVNLLRAYSDIMSLAIRKMQLREASDNASQEAEREGLRAALLSAVSHDLKTPLVSIIGSLSTLRQVGGGLPEEDRMELLITASEEAERLHTIIHNVLELTRLESGQVTPRMVDVDVETMISSLLERCRRYYPKLRVAVTTPPPLPWVEADPLLLEEVLYNLIDNAAKYAGTDHPLELSTELINDIVEIRIADRGPGIVPEEREKVFDKYFRSASRDSRTAGSGLGLAISRAIIEACHGHIWVEGRKDGETGTVMVLQLPFAEPSNNYLHQEENDHE